jgi:hypothetical protein
VVLERERKRLQADAGDEWAAGAMLLDRLSGTVTS